MTETTPMETMRTLHQVRVFIFFRALRKLKK